MIYLLLFGTSGLIGSAMYYIGYNHGKFIGYEKARSKYSIKIGQYEFPVITNKNLPEEQVIFMNPATLRQFPVRPFDYEG